MKDVIAECLDSLEDLSNWDEKIFEVVCKSATSCCSMLLEALDEELVKRRDKGLRMIGKRTKTIVTKFGSFKIRRRLYRDRKGRARFLLDDALGLRPRSQATSSLKTTVLGLASKMPFREAAALLEDTSGGILSHQMIHRITQNYGGLLDAKEEKEQTSLFEDGLLPQSGEKKADHLFIEADGTMINLQQSTKKKREIKLAVAHEGWEKKGKDKWALKNKTVLTGLHSSCDIWQRFTTTLLGVYTPDVLEKTTVVGGDGASWPKEGEEHFSGSIYQLDRFHLLRALLRATGTMNSASSAYGLAVEGNLSGALSVLEKRARLAPERTENINKVANYLKNNFHGLIDYRKRIKEDTADMRGLGSIEGNIDKIIANRMKKRGMAWSPEGAHHMAKVIQMRINGMLGKEEAFFAKDPNPQYLKKAFTHTKRAFKQDPATWLSARMPALLGPHPGRPWVKALRDITNATPVGMHS